MSVDVIRILIADDHALFRDGLRALFASLPDTVLVGEGATGWEAVRKAEALQPDVVLMDIHMPGRPSQGPDEASEISGIEATRRIVRTSPHIAVVMLTMFEDDDSLFAAMRAGARGYVLKGAGQEEMVRVVHAVARGEALFGSAVAERLMRYFSRARLTTGNLFPELTEREREVLALMAQGYNNQRIAHQLGISIKTVRNHASNIFSKLQVADRTEAIIRARDAGMGGEMMG